MEFSCGILGLQFLLSLGKIHSTEKLFQDKYRHTQSGASWTQLDTEEWLIFLRHKNILSTTIKDNAAE